MTFLNFSSESKRDKVLKYTTTTSTNTSKLTPSERILNRVPPKIEAIKCSDVLSRAAAFLPQLAASNRAILEKKPDEINIEVLNGEEEEIIEMKLGLGVFEERKGRRSRPEDDSKQTNDTESSSEDESSSDDSCKSRKIMILPSELRAAAASKSNQSSDPYENIIKSLLFFDDSEEESTTTTAAGDDESMEILEFE